jgi:hypothetical protein
MTIIAASAYAKHLVPHEELLERISSLLEEAPRTMKELEALTGYSHRPIKAHLLDLIEDGLAYQQRITSTHGYKNLYHAGTGTGIAPVLRAGEMMRQRVTRTYPTINRCDPLVAQFFGHLAARPANVLEMER